MTPVRQCEMERQVDERRNPDQKALMQAAERQRNPLGRGLALLARMVDLGKEAYGVHELANELGLPPSSVYRILSLLEAAEMVTQTRGGHYQLGNEFYRIAWRASGQHTVRRLAQPLLEEMARATDEATILGIFDPLRGEMMFVSRCDSRFAVQHLTPLGEWIPVYSGASGLVILAEVPEPLRERIIDRGLVRQASNTIQDPPTLRRELRRIHQAGYAVSHSQRTEGAVGTAAAFFDADGCVLGCILLTVPEQRYDPADGPLFARLVVDGADRLSEQLGSRRPRRALDM